MVAPTYWERRRRRLFAILGIDITDSAVTTLPPTAGCGPNERIVRRCQHHPAERYGCKLGTAQGGDLGAVLHSGKSCSPRTSPNDSSKSYGLSLLLLLDIQSHSGFICVPTVVPIPLRTIIAAHEVFGACHLSSSRCGESPTLATFEIYPK